MAKDVFSRLGNSPFLWGVINAIHHRLWWGGTDIVTIGLIRGMQMSSCLSSNGKELLSRGLKWWAPFSSNMGTATPFHVPRA